jgi:hypothetical protein
MDPGRGTQRAASKSPDPYFTDNKRTIKIMAPSARMLAEKAGIESRKTIMDESYMGALSSKWGEFLEGVPGRSESDRYLRGCTAILMENQSEWLQSMDEDTRQANVGTFTKFIFPILRRVFPNLIANEIVSVQPMTAPTGAVFFLDYVYASSKGQTGYTPGANGAAVGATPGYNSSGTNPNATFPDQFDQNYSAEFINGEPLVTGGSGKYGGVGAAISTVKLAWAPVRDVDSVNSYSVVISEVAQSTGAVVQSATMNAGGGSFTFSTGAITNAAGSLSLNDGTLTGFKFENAVGAGNQVLAYYFYNGEANSSIPQISLNVRQLPVQAIPRRLKALWSSEAAEDLRALHGVDAEAEMVATIAQEIALEIDREIIQDLFKNSTGTTASWDRTPPAAISEHDHIRSLITQISTVSNLIHKKTLRSPANFIVTSPEVSALFAQLTTHGDFNTIFSSDTGTPYGSRDVPRPLSRQGQFGVYKVGTLMGKWTVYEDPYFTRNQMLVGLKGDGYLNAGYAWAPYVPLQVTPTFLDPADMTMRKGLRTRYAKKLLRSEFYGSIAVSNL